MSKVGSKLQNACVATTITELACKSIFLGKYVVSKTFRPVLFRKHARKEFKYNEVKTVIVLLRRREKDAN